ncbi:hypothetical protein [Altericista sp. CCNU0014]|uniref:hypothetical protein n=1 Tax=Altericista sp. CCNU0014 TaxID=3082949 RepID=UPI00384D7F3A
MKALKFLPIGVSGLVFLFLGACSGGNQTASNVTSSVTTDTAAKSPERPSKGSGGSENHPKASKGGQVIESGPYHLELVPKKEASGTHLDFYLQKGDTHTAIPDATVKAQVQLPDGTQKSLDLKYDPDGQHYAAILSSSVTGEYKVAILSNINGEKVNGRFSFKQ